MRLDNSQRLYGDEPTDPPAVDGQQSALSLGLQDLGNRHASPLG